VKLDGQGFNALVNQGDTVVAGQPLIEFDSQIIQKQNFDDTVMIVVTNSNNTKDVIIESKAHFNKQDDLFAIIY
jgi:phosphotransferase system IIA component